MSATRRAPEMNPGEETVRLLAILVRQNLPTQNDAILELSRAGFGPTRIGELVGTTTATAKVTVARAKKTKTKKTRA